MLLPGGLKENKGDPLYEVNEDLNMLVPEYQSPLIDNCHLPSGINYLDIRSPGKPLPMEQAMHGARCVN